MSMEKKKPRSTAKWCIDCSPYYASVLSMYFSLPWVVYRSGSGPLIAYRRLNDSSQALDVGSADDPTQLSAFGPATARTS